MKTFRVLLSVVFLCGLSWAALAIAKAAWVRFELLNPTLSVGVIAAAGTILASTLTVVLGRYYERKKDLEATLRQKKIEIYDEFLRELFRAFHSPGGEGKPGERELVDFMREWQRKFILWSGEDVVLQYVAWMNELTAMRLDAQAMFKTEEMVLAVRKDLGLPSQKLVRGTLIRLLLRSPELFLAAAQRNPNIKLTELAMLEAEKPS